MNLQSNLTVHYDRFSNQKVKIFRRNGKSVDEDGFVITSLLETEIKAFFSKSSRETYLRNYPTVDPSEMATLTTTAKLNGREFSNRPDFIYTNGELYEIIGIKFNNIIFKNYEYDLKRTAQIPSEIKEILDREQNG